MNDGNEKTIFGVSIDKIKKQCINTSHSCDSNSPIKDNEYLAPCIRGGIKILNDPEKKEMMREILRGK